jgi:hypothetical protein
LATRQELGSKFGGRLNCGFTCFAKVAAVALANKIARMAWRSLFMASGTEYPVTAQDCEHLYC